MNRKRLLLHTGFWAAYATVSIFTELYLSVSFNSHPSAGVVAEVALAQLLLMPVKMAAVYYVLYSLIPRWLKSSVFLKRILETLAAMTFFVLCYRAVIHFVIWPYITFVEPPQFTALQYAARLMYSVLDLLQVTGVAAAIKLFRLRIEAIQNEKALIQEKLFSEIMHLKSQINPHFLFNMLNSIYSLARAGSPQTPGTVMTLSKILRYMLYETSKKKVLLTDELKIIGDYLELQQLRFGDKIEIVFEKNLSGPPAEITPLLLFPLVENVFKHRTGENARIVIRVTLADQLLDVHMSNPVAPAAGKLNGTEGIGLPNIRRQLELLYRDYSFTNAERDGTFFVDLHINLESYAGFELFSSRG